MDEELQKEKNPETESTENIENPAESAPEQTAPEQAGEAENLRKAKTPRKKRKKKAFLERKSRMQSLASCSSRMRR